MDGDSEGQSSSEASSASAGAAGAPCGAAAGASAKVQVRFFEEVNKSFSVNVDPGVTILDLKNKVYDRTALDVHSFELNLKYLGRTALSDQDTLKSLALKFGTNDFEFEIKQQGVLGGMVCL
jgi:hypothetical protein